MEPHQSSKSNAACKVLVLGEDDRIVLSIVRSLGRAGIEVHLGWCRASSLAGRSRYTNTVHEIPWCPAQHDRWTGALDALIDRHDFDLIIPATENVVFALQKARQELTHASRFALSGEDAFRVASNKQATYELCEQLQISYPRTEQITHPNQFDALADGLGLPLIVKPCCSINAENKLGKDFVRVCRSREDALQYVRYLHERGSQMMLQQYRQGEGVGVELLACDGEILIALQHRRLHETTGHGSTYRETTPLDPRLLDACKKLMRRMNYMGVAMVEFRVDPNSDEWTLLEINGRFWGSLPLAEAAGVDFPLHLFEMIVAKRRKFKQTYRVGLRSRALANDIRWLWRRLSGRGKTFDADHTDSLGWVVNEVPWRHVLVAIWRGVTLRDRIDAFARDDMVPATWEILGLLKEALASLWASGIETPTSCDRVN